MMPRLRRFGVAGPHEALEVRSGIDRGLGTNAYVAKPVDFEHFIDAIRQIDTFFLTLVKLPVLGPAPI